MYMYAYVPVVVCVWVMCGLCTMYGLCVDYVWIMYGLCMVCMVCTRGKYGIMACNGLYRMYGVCDAYGNILEGFAKNQIARNVTGPNKIEI